MITFKNIAGNKFLAVGTIQRKSALNGEKSLTGTLYDGKDVLNKIDKGWSLEFDGEPYIVTYFERNDNDNSVSFDAIHKFFWDMTKKVLYSSTEISGSHTIKWYLDQIFANTGYTYALNFSPAAIEKDNWGNKTRLSLFNDLITSIAGEFEINGTLISIFQNIGTDLSTIVRYGFNLSDMTLENDATSFVTYGEGFGAYANQENQTGDRVHVTYTSPLAGVYGILQAEPIDDQRYTSQANLQAAVKAQVDASFSVSVQLSLYDLTAAGYPYKMANVGDWLTAVDENLDFKQRIRIISIDDEFSADGTRISYTVTAGDIGLTKKYQDANASMASQVANAIVSAGQASTDANFALIAANGKLTAYYVGSYDDLPTTANEGDLGWVTSGDGRLLYIYTKKADGSYYWEKRIDPEMGDQIAAGVTEAVTQANAHTDAVKQGLSTDIATAKSQAASQASTAEANAKSAATSQFNQAQSALSSAKTELTNSITSEASARNQAVAAANSQAQTYANQAKSDAMSAASSADGVIRTSISSSANSLSATITQNKSSADSGISTAQTTAKAAVDGLALKVSKTDYDQKTGDLSTKINDVKQTADSSAQTIADIKTADGKQDARMSEIENTASGLKSTVSDLSTAQDKQSGYISELKQSAKSFEGSIREIHNTVNGLSQTNQLMNTEFTPDFQGWENVSPLSITASVDNSNNYNGSNIINLVHGSNVQWSQFRQSISNFVKGSQISASVWAKSTQNNSSVTIDSYDSSNTRTILATKTLSSAGSVVKFENITIPANSVGIYIAFWSRTAGTISFSQPMFVFESTVGQYVQGNYNNNEALAKVKLTADQASLDLSTYKKDANGLISKAQAGVEANATAITKKVSQSDYDKKTGELSNKLNTTTDTANGTQQALSDYKEYANGNISGVASDLRKLAGEVDLKLSKTDYDDSQSKLNTSLLQWKADYDGWTGTVSRLSDKVNDLEQVNQLLNTEFTPDLEGWDTSETSSGVKTPYRQYLYKGSNMLTLDTRNQTGTKYSSIKQTIPFSTSGSDRVVSLSWWSRIAQGSDLYGSTHIRSYDANMAKLTDVAKNWDSSSSMTLQKFENVAIPDGAQFVEVTFAVREGYLAFLAKPMLVYQSTVGAYVQGNYNNNAALAQVKITADSISNFVRDSSGNISSDFQTALSKTSIITGSTLATSIQKQTATQITQAVTDNNKNIIAMINLDTSGVQIAGKNIVLNGDTTVTGTFKVSQANIANGAIGTAQIGDVAITNAKIADLDVSKITGNVTNFIQSYWNGIYGSTNITSSGMIVNTGSSFTEFVQSGVEFNVITTQTSGAKVTETIGSLRTARDSANSSTNRLMMVLNDQTYKNIGSPSGKTWGGDKIGLGIMSDLNGGVDDLFTWQNATAANGSGKEGFNFYHGKINFNGNEIAINGATNNLLFGWNSWSNWFNGEKNPTIQASNGDFRGAGLAFGNKNIVVYYGGNAKLLL